MTDKSLKDLASDYLRHLRLAAAGARTAASAAPASLLAAPDNSSDHARLPAAHGIVATCRRRRHPSLAIQILGALDGLDVRHNAFVARPGAAAAARRPRAKTPACTGDEPRRPVPRSPWRCRIARLVRSYAAPGCRQHSSDAASPRTKTGRVCRGKAALQHLRRLWTRHSRRRHPWWRSIPRHGPPRTRRVPDADRAAFKRAETAAARDYGADRRAHRATCARGLAR